MDETLRTQIYNTLKLRETEYLLDIWQNQDTDEWDEEVFDILREILSDRLGDDLQPSMRSQEKEALRKIDDYYKTENFDKALLECEALIQTAPDLAKAYNYRGLVYDAMGQLEKAVADYREALRLDPELIDALQNLQSAETDMEDAFQHSLSKQHLDQALEYINQDEHEKAVEECELARQTMPGIAKAYNVLGLILEELRQWESAENVYLEAIRLNPEYDPARENLSNVRVKLEEQQYRQSALDDWSEERAETELFSDTDEDGLEYQDTAPGWLTLDERAFLLTGWPGHRLRQGRSGYDPLDMDFELAHVEGLMVRWLFTGKFLTQHAIYLLGMIFLSALGLIPLVLGAGDLLHGSWLSIALIVAFSPYWVVGLALLTNVFLSLRSTNLADQDITGGSCD